MNPFDADKFVEEFEAQQFENCFEQSNVRPKLPTLEMMSPILPLSPIPPPFSAQHDISCTSVQTSEILVWDSPQGSSSVTNSLSNRNTFSLRKFAQHQSSINQPTSSAVTNKHTPKSSRKVYNPFESMALESLTSNMCSPGIFRRNKSGKRGFQWTIDEKAILCPVNLLDTEIPSPSPSAPEFFSPGFEKKAQSALNHYWQNVHYLPSPDTAQKKKCKNFVSGSETFLERNDIIGMDSRDDGDDNDSNYEFRNDENVNETSD